jgi:hypothetical protein
VGEGVGGPFGTVAREAREPYGRLTLPLLVGVLAS